MNMSRKPPTRSAQVMASFSDFAAANMACMERTPPLMRAMPTP